MSNQYRIDNVFGLGKKKEKEDQEIANTMVEFAEDMTSTYHRWRFLGWFGGILFICWIVAILLPNFVAKYLILHGSSKIVMAVLAIPLCSAVFLGYTIALDINEDLETGKKNPASDSRPELQNHRTTMLSEFWTRLLCRFS